MRHLSPRISSLLNPGTIIAIALWCMGLIYQGHAQLKNYLFLSGIPGESQSINHANWIEILNFQSSITRTSTLAKPNFSSIDLSKLIDRASPKLAEYVRSQKIIPSATIHATLLVDKEVVLEEIQLSNVVVQAFSQYGQQDALATDLVELRYQRISWNITHLRNDGSKGGTYDFYWDLKTNTGGSTSGPLTLEISEASATEWSLSWVSTAGTTYQILASQQVNGRYATIDTVSAPSTGVMTRRFPKFPGMLFFRLSTLP